MPILCFRCLMFLMLLLGNHIAKDFSTQKAIELSINKAVFLAIPMQLSQPSELQ